MLYLEDFIELIEQLPQDLRDRFTDMRELDLKVQNTIDTLDTRVRKLFSDARKGKAEETDREYNSIHSSYKQALDDAGEKVLMASQVYDLVDRHLRKLDQELGRFKMELEADCSGITEILERRSTTNEDNSLDLLYNKDSTNNHKRKFGDIERLSTANLTNGGTSSTEKSLTGIFTSLAASYASAKPTPTPPAAATGKQNGISSLHHSKSSPSLSTDSSKDGRGAQAILNAMTAAQKKAEKLVLDRTMKKYISRREFSRRLELYVDSTRTCFEASLRSFEEALIKVNKRMDQISCNVEELKRQLDCDAAGLRFIPPLEIRTNHNEELEKLREISLNKIRISRQQCTGEKIELVENSRIKKVKREIGCDNLLSPDEWKIAARKQIAALHIQNEDKLNFSDCEHAEFSESESDVISDSERVSDCDSDSDSCFSLDKESSFHKMQEFKFDKLDKVISQIKDCSQHRHEDALEESDIITFNIKREELSDTDEDFNNLNENKKQWVPDKNNNLDDDKKQSENDQNTDLDNKKSGNSLSLSGLMAPSSSSHKQSSSSQSYIDVTGYQSSSSQKSSQSSQSSRIPKSGRRAHKNMGGSQGDSKYPGPSIDWVPDPNEPTYCICNQVSYGEMVGCDNNSCPIEWFHYGCVGLTDAPKGKWYCRDCSVQIKKKRMR